MRASKSSLLVIFSALTFGVLGVLAASDPPRKPRNVIIFVADGLRPGSVNPTDTPALWSVRTEGVNFVNSHSLFPTLTMPNASAIATGHYLGDTGQFANNIFPGFPLYDTGNFGLTAGALSPDTEYDQVLGDINDHFGGNYLGEATLLSRARAQGYSTAAVGKLGPAAIQDMEEISPQSGAFRPPSTIVIDDATGAQAGVPLSPEAIAMLTAAGLGTLPTPRDQPRGTNTTPGTLAANVAHQQWFADAITKAILPGFRGRKRPFVLVFWSGDPDQTQHAQGDSLNKLAPGINGPTSKSAVRNADHDLQQILDYISGLPDLRDNTDVFVTGDHGFSTVSRHEIDNDGHFTKSFSASFIYRDTTGRQEVNTGFLPPGFLAIDLAHALNLPLFDPDSQIAGSGGVRMYQPVDPTIPQQTAAVRQRPSMVSGLIGGTGRIAKPWDAKVLVTAGSIYVLDNNPDTARRSVAFLAAQDYVGGVFVNDALGEMPGALPMSAVGLLGSTRLPRPSVMVNYRSFSTDPKDPLMTSVLLYGSQNHQHGQGNHGALSRANTFNNMAVIGPDFKKHFVDTVPVGNADVQPTLASILGMRIPSAGTLRGRVLVEALAGGPSSVSYEKKVMRSKAAASGNATVLMYQQAGHTRYFDEACFTVCLPGSPATR